MTDDPPDLFDQAVWFMVWAVLHFTLLMESLQ